MTIIYADLALLPGGWGKNVCVALGDDGCISEVKFLHVLVPIQVLLAYCPLL